MKRILSISGGGCRGFLPALTLVEIERRTGKPCCQLFDQIAGTSVGSILAALLAIGVPASDAIKFFSEDGPLIFKKQFSMFGLMRPMYPDAVLESRLADRFKGAKLSDCKTRLLIPAFDWATEQPWFFKSYDPCPPNLDWLLWQCCRASSSAQTYFRAFDCNGHLFWDGGNTTENNPAKAAFADGIKAWGIFDQIKVLSLGCGDTPLGVDVNRIADAGSIYCALASLAVLFDASSEETDYLFRTLIQDDYVSFNPVLTQKIDLADASENARNEMRALWGQSIGAFSNKLDDFFK